MVGTGLGLATTAGSAVAFGFDTGPGLATTVDLRSAAADSTAATAGVVVASSDEAVAIAALKEHKRKTCKTNGSTRF